MSGDSSYQVDPHDWPIVAEDDLATDRVLEVLAAFDSFYPQAVKALATTAVPHFPPTGQQM